MPRIRGLRKRLGFNLEEVSKRSGWSVPHLRALEANEDELDEIQVRVLSDLYGTDIEDVLSRGDENQAAVESKAPPVSTLLKAQKDVLTSETRFRIAEAVTVARQIRELQRRLGEDDGWAWVSGWRTNPDYEHPRYGMPKKLADAVRTRLNLGSAPVASMKDVLERCGVALVWVELENTEIDAVSIATDETGAIVISNTHGDHMATAYGRRITWAHELCHLLFDRGKMKDMRRFCAAVREEEEPRAADERDYKIERRARAFAGCFLAPEEAVEAQWTTSAGSDAERIRAVMEHFGIGFEATRVILGYMNLLSLETDVTGVPTHSTGSWETADPGWCPSLMAQVAMSRGVPPPRAGLLLELTLKAVGTGAISESAACDQLRVTRDQWEQLRHGLAQAGRLPAGGTWPAPEPDAD